MDKTLPLEPSSEDAAEMFAAIDRYLREIDELRRRMAKDQAEITASQQRTRALLAQLKAG